MEKWPKIENNNEKEKTESEAENINHALDEIKETGLFPNEYLNSLKIVVFDNELKPQELIDSGKMIEADLGDFDARDFMFGKRTDFVVTHPKDAFEKRSSEKIDDRHFFPTAFLEGRLSYEEFLSHEIGHNIFDKEYKNKFGDFKEKEGVTDVSNEYKRNFGLKIKESLSDRYPRLDIDRFKLNRFNISEIFAYLYEKEYCKRSGDNFENHERAEEKIDSFLEDQEGFLSDFNEKHSRNCTLEDFYEENHILSLLVTPILEKKYPEFQERTAIFWK